MEKLRLEINDCGDKRYYKWDTCKLHNPYGPAIERANGNKVWYLNDKRHRKDGPAFECTNGDKEWYVNGKRHREDGPAVEYAHGHKEWWINGKFHREDGPAVEDANGTKFWYLNGVEFTEEEFNSRHSSCTSKIVKIDGKRYKLEKV